MEASLPFYQSICYYSFSQLGKNGIFLIHTLVWLLQRSKNKCTRGGYIREIKQGFAQKTTLPTNTCVIRSLILASPSKEWQMHRTMQTSSRIHYQYKPISSNRHWVSLVSTSPTLSCVRQCAKLRLKNMYVSPNK